MNEEKLSEIKSLYKFYHKQFWCHKKAYKHFQRINLLTDMSSTSLDVHWSNSWWNNSEPNTIGNNFVKNIF